MGQERHRHAERHLAAPVRVDPRYFRPTEVDTLLGDATKAQQKLGWTAQVTFPALVAEMAGRPVPVWINWPVTFR